METHKGEHRKRQKKEGREGAKHYWQKERQNDGGRARKRQRHKIPRKTVREKDLWWLICLLIRKESWKHTVKHTSTHTCTQRNTFMASHSRAQLLINIKVPVENEEGSWVWIPGERSYQITQYSWITIYLHGNVKMHKSLPNTSPWIYSFHPSSCCRYPKKGVQQTFLHLLFYRFTEGTRNVIRAVVVK